MEILTVPTDSITPYANNSRTHSNDQIRQIAASIEEFGFTNPILTHEGTVVAGHGRLEAAKLLGLETVPTVDLGHLSPTQMRAYVIADNQLAQASEWDMIRLHEELSDLVNEIDLSIIGFSEDELEHIIDPADLEFPEVNIGEPNEPSEIACPSCGHSFTQT